MSFTDNLNLEEVPNNGDIDTWDVPTNANWGIVDTMWGGSAAINATGASGTVAIATASYQCNIIIFSGVPSGATTYRMPTSVGGRWIFENNCTGSFSTLSIDSAAGGSAQTLTTGTRTIYTADGSSTGMKALSGLNAGGSSTQVQFNQSGVLAGSSKLTWDGSTLTVTGGVHIATAGNVLTFPDGTTQATALASGPGGSNTYIQYNNSGGFGGDAKLIWNAGTSTLSVTGSITSVGGVIGTTSGYFKAGFQAFSSLPGAGPAAGAIAAINDGPGSTSWGSIISIGGGAVPMLLFANGLNWVRIG